MFVLKSTLLRERNHYIEIINKLFKDIYELQVENLNLKGKKGFEPVLQTLKSHYNTGTNVAIKPVKTRSTTESFSGGSSSLRYDDNPGGGIITAAALDPGGGVIGLEPSSSFHGHGGSSGGAGASGSWESPSSSGHSSHHSSHSSHSDGGSSSSSYDSGSSSSYDSGSSYSDSGSGAIK